MKSKTLPALLTGIVLTALASTASAQLIDLRLTSGNWVATTVSSNNYTVIGSNFSANSVFAGNGTTVQRWDNTNTTPTVGNTYSGVSPQQMAANNPGNYAFANLGTSMIRLNATANQTETVSSTAWSTIAQDIPSGGAGFTNAVYGLTSTGQVGRVFFAGSWITQFGSALNNPTTGYTTIAGADSQGLLGAGRMFYSSGSGLGLDRTYFNGSVWVFDNNITATSFDLLSWAPTLANTVYGANSSGLSRVHFTSSWVTQSINSKVYSSIISDREVAFQLFGITATGIDRIYSTDNGANWTTEEILAGTFTGIADNLGVGDALFVIPEPSTGLLLLGGLGAMALLCRRKRTC